MHEEDGYGVYVYNPPREHGPAHVHVIRAEGEVAISPAPVVPTEIYNMPTRNVVQAVRIVDENREMLLLA